MLHLVFEIPVRRRDDAHVHPDVRGAADTLEGLLFEKSQQLGLQPRHHLTDFVQEHGAAIRHLEQSAFLLASVGKGATLVAE